MDWKPIETAPKDMWVLIRGGDFEFDEDDAVCNGRPPCLVAILEDSKYGIWRFASYDSGYYGQCHEPAEWRELP